MSLYVHIPWCVRKCPYCDFNSHPFSGELPEAQYLKAIQEDLQQQLNAVGTHQSPVELTSVFFGGGTPSLFSPYFFEQVLEIAQPLLVANAEVTMEVNPGTREYHNFSDYRSAGINRLSIGAQSFDDTALATLGRIHKAFEIVDCFRLAREAEFENINLDLMHGLPDQNLNGALSDLHLAINLQPEHISWYQLTIEAKTEFAKRPPLLPVEDVLLTVEKSGLELLAKHGFNRYEISAFAQPGKQCNHNINYWSFGDYLGIGAGAHGKISGAKIVRTAKPNQPRLYLRDPLSTTRTEVAEDELPAEFMMNALRLVAGVPQSLFTERTRLSLQQVQPVIDELVERKLMSAGRISATAQGLRYLDNLVSAFL